jgi:cell division ATPase FtsA
LEKMEQLNIAWKLPGGVLLIGGWSKIKNIEDFTREYFQLAAKHWKIINDSFKDLGSNPQFVNVIGNYIWEDKYGNESSWFSLNFLNFDGFGKIVEFFKKIF